MASDTSVVSFLKTRNLSEYVELFVNNGFDDLEDLLRLEDADLKQLGVAKMGHRMKILRELKAAADAQEAMSPVRPPTPGRSFSPHGPHAAAGDDAAAEPEETREEYDRRMAQQKSGRRRSRSYAPSSPVPRAGEEGESAFGTAEGNINVRTQPRHQYGGDRIVIELLAAKLEVAGEVAPQVKISLCKTVDSKGIPMEKTVQRSSVREGAQPSWHEEFEVPAVISEQTYLVIAVNNKAGVQAKRIGLVAIPTKFFHPFTDSTVVDNWFPIKIDHGVRTGEIHLRLRVPGGIPSQTGKAFKVTGVKMEQQKLHVEVIEAEVPLSSKGKPRSAYVKLTLPDKRYVCRETGLKKTQKPKWFEGFVFYSEVKQSQYLLVKLKKWARLQHITMGIAKIPLMFFLSIKDKMVLDNWYPCRDQDGKEQGRVRVRMLVKPRTPAERGLLWAPDDSYVVTDCPKICPALVPQAQSPLRSPRRRSSRSPTTKRSPRGSPARPKAAAASGGSPQPAEGDGEQHWDPARDAADAEAEEAEEAPEEEYEEFAEEEYEEVEADDEEDEEYEEGEGDAEPEKEDDTFDVQAHHDDFASLSPKGKGQVCWPPQAGAGMPDGVLRDAPSPAGSPAY